MESRIPVPTDNIFKFYALFGLLLFVFSCGAQLYVIRNSNEVIYAAFPELEGLTQIAQPSPAEVMKINVLKKKLEINKADRDSFLIATSVLIVISMIALGYGFYKWHTEVQPVLDRTAKVQLEMAQLQLAKLRHELEASGALDSKVSAPTMIVD